MKSTCLCHVKESTFTVTLDLGGSSGGNGISVAGYKMSLLSDLRLQNPLFSKLVDILEKGKLENGGLKSTAEELIQVICSWLLQLDISIGYFYI